MNVQDVDLNLPGVRRRAARKGCHAGGAAPRLTQPAVSNALARLRKLFGDPLFVRTPGGVDATPFARELAEPVRQALALLESALAHGPGFDPTSSTRAFRFYMSDLGQIEFLPPPSSGYTATRPGCASKRSRSRSTTSAMPSQPGRSMWRSDSCPGWARRWAPGSLPRSLPLPHARRPLDHHSDEKALPRSIARARHLPRRP